MKHNFVHYGFAPDISREELNTLPRAVFAGEILVIDTLPDLRRALVRLKGISTIGLDTETKPAFVPGKRNDVSLLQIASDDLCLLIRLNRIGLSPELCTLFEDESILKIGLSLHDDLRSLKRMASFTPKGFVELQQLAPAYGLHCASLQKLYAIIVGQYLSKKQRLSNWEARHLSEAQQQYAALDAYASLYIYKELIALPKPEPTQFALVHL